MKKGGEQEIFTQKERLTYMWKPANALSWKSNPSWNVHFFFSQNRMATIESGAKHSLEESAGLIPG